MDIMYTETDIRKDTSQQVFQRGKWLYQSGNVQHIQIQDVYIEETPCKKIKAYVQFCLALSAWSIESDDKIVFRSMNGYTAKKKVTLMYNILTNRLGLYGDEFKTCRLHMMKQLRENANAEHVA